MIDKNFWKNKKVFITGHTGFKGGWLSLWLKKLGAHVSGYALKPKTNRTIFFDADVSTSIDKSYIGDIRDEDLLLKSMKSSKPEIVIHMAAQPLVKESYLNPKETYSTNIMGTINVFEAIRKISSIKAILNITTDKCYKNNEWDWGYRENEPLGGNDPYSSSKGCSEIISIAYRKSFFSELGIALATARAGNVIGGGDWSKDRIIPDSIKALIKNRTLLIRNPSSTRPWQHVLDPLCGYIILCQNLVKGPKLFSESWNFGPYEEDARPVSYIVEKVVKNWDKKVEWNLDKTKHKHEDKYLKLDCSKARKKLLWKPNWRLERALKETVSWYKAWSKNIPMKDFTLNQISIYENEKY